MLCAVLAAVGEVWPLWAFHGCAIWLPFPLIMLAAIRQPMFRQVAQIALGAGLGLSVGLSISAALPPLEALVQALTDTGTAVILAGVARHVCNPGFRAEAPTLGSRKLDCLLMTVASAALILPLAGLIAVQGLQAHVAALPHDAPWPAPFEWAVPRFAALCLMLALQAALAMGGASSGEGARPGLGLPRIAMLVGMFLIGAYSGLLFGQSGDHKLPLLGAALFICLAGTPLFGTPRFAVGLTLTGVLSTLQFAWIATGTTTPPTSLAALLSVAAIAQSLTAIMRLRRIARHHLRAQSFEGARARLMLLDGRLGVLGFNAAARQFTGLAPRIGRLTPLDQLPGARLPACSAMHPAGFHPQDSQGRTRAALRSFEIGLPGADGQTRACTVRLRPLRRGEDPDTVLYLGEIIDRDAQARLQRSLPREGHLAPDLSLVFAEDGAIVHVSPDLAEDLARPATALLAGVIDDIFDEDARIWAKGLFAQPVGAAPAWPGNWPATLPDVWPDAGAQDGPQGGPQSGALPPPRLTPPQLTPVHLCGISFLAAPRPVRTPAGLPRLRGVALTSLERMLTEQQMNRVLLKEGPAVIVTMGRDGVITDASDAWQTRFGHVGAVGRNFADFLPPDQAPIFRDMLDRAKAGHRLSGMIDLMSCSGERRRVELICVVLEGETRWRLMVSINDVSELIRARKAAEEQLDHDELTGLSSRRALLRRLAGQSRTDGLAVLVIDIDYFKSVNDLHGHEAGDRLLAQIGPVLRREAGAEAFCGRLGGEEFVILHPDTGWEGARDLADRIRRAVALVQIGTGMGSISRSVSIGVALGRPALSAKTLVHMADRALQMAKRGGRNRIVLADRSFTRAQWEAGTMIGLGEIRRAIRDNELSFHLQPICNLQDGYVAGFEALIRWVRPSGRILPTKYFLEQLLASMENPDCRAWMERTQTDLIRGLHSHPGAFIAFNIRIEALCFPGAAALMDPLQAAARETGRTLVLEITETQAVDRLDLATARREIDTLRRKGFLLALDDFGKEASNLSRLIAMPVDIVKIDRDFVARVETDRRAQEAVKAIGQMCNNLGIKVVVEGVERETQKLFAESLGIQYVQGYLLGRPVPLETIEAEARKPRTASAAQPCD